MHTVSSPSHGGAPISIPENAAQESQSHSDYSRSASGSDQLNPTSDHSEGACLNYHTGGLNIGVSGNGGILHLNLELDS